MQIKQNKQELDREYKLLMKRLQPYRLLCLDPQPNEVITATKDSAAINEQMLRTFTGPDGQTDYSAENVYRVICRLRDQLTWREGFAPKKPTNDPIARRSHTDPLGVVDAAQRERERATKVAQSERDTAILNACANLVATGVYGRTHSIRGKRQAELKTKFEQLVASKTRPENIYELLRSQIRSWN